MLTDVPLAKQLEINDWTHQKNIPFIAADTRGLFGCVPHNRYSTAQPYIFPDLSSMTLVQNLPVSILPENNLSLA